MSEVISLGGLFQIHCDDELERYRANSLYTKEPETVLWIEDFFRKTEIFYDIGANIGIYALFARAKKDVAVYAFEPFQKNYARLLENIRLNGYTDVGAFNIALSDRCEVSRFYSFDVRYGASGGQINAPTTEANKSFDAIDVADVLTFPVDGLVREFGFPPPHHVKIDVDGNEQKILAGMARTLSDTRLRSLLIEVNPHVTGVKTMIEDLRNLGFSTDNKYNNAVEHSRNRRKAKGDAAPENIVFTR